MSKWISCSFQLPEKAGYYLTTIQGCMISIKATWYSKNSNQFNYDETKPTHWMPLPSSPKIKRIPMKEIDIDQIINMNYRLSTLLGIATALINKKHCDDERKWFLQAINDVVYLNKPIPSIPEDK